MLYKKIFLPSAHPTIILQIYSSVGSWSHRASTSLTEVALHATEAISNAIVTTCGNPAAYALVTTVVCSSLLDVQTIIKTGRMAGPHGFLGERGEGMFE